MTNFEKRLKEQAEACTEQGPWKAEEFHGCWDVIYSDDPELPVGINSWSFSLLETLTKSHAEFIAAANPKTILTLLQIIEVQRKALKRFSYLDQCHEDCRSWNPYTPEPCTCGVRVREPFYTCSQALAKVEQISKEAE